MTRKKVIDLDADQTLKFTEKGQTFEGHYIGNREVKTDFGASKLHVFKTAEGNQGLWGSAKMDSKLATVPAGCMTFITYGGKVKIPGGKTMHKYEVEYDDEDTIDVSSTEINLSSGEEEQEEGEADDVPPPAAAVATKRAKPAVAKAAAPAEQEIDETQAAEEDDNSGDDEEESKPLKTATVSRPPVSAPSKASVDKTSALLSKRV